ncbi:MAG: hypothetical protein ACYTFG_14145 [Planctomycetota bacterium]
MALEYYSFEKVLKELQMDEDELKRLVSEGQIRAFRDEDKMKFRADDIVGLKKGRQTEPTIILPPSDDADGGADDIMLVDDDTDETLLDLEDLGADDLGESDETSIPSLDMDEDDASADTLTEELVFDDDLGLEDGAETDEIATQETFIDDDEEVGMTTEPLDLDDEEEEDEKPKTVIATRRGASTVRAPRGSGRVSGASLPPEEEEVSPLMLGVSIVAALILLFVGLLLMDVARVGKTGLSASVAAMVQKNLTDDGEPEWLGEGKKKSGGKEDEDEEAEAEEEPEEEEE